VLYIFTNKTGLASHDWKLPFYFALILHLGLVIGGIYLPNLLKAKPKFADIYTVSLINISEPAPAPPPAPQIKAPPPPVKAAPPKIKEVLNKKVAPIEEQVKTETVAKQDAISLKPLKKKIVNKVPEKPKVDLEAERRKEEQKKRELAEQKRKQLAEALRREQLLAEQARLAQEAVEQERNLLKTTPTPAFDRPASQNQTLAGRTGTGIGSSNNLISSQYHAAIINRLSQFWALPEYLQKNQTLEAVVVITINQNGQILDHFFEERSGDRVFDQFVSKAIEDANPLPPIPPAMKKQRYEVGLRFRPGSIK